MVVGIKPREGPVTIPDATRAVAASAETTQGAFRGAGVVPEGGGDVPLSLWPASNACSLYAVPDADSYPQHLDGVAMGYSPATSTVLVVGGLPASAPGEPSDSTSALVVDVATGGVSQVESNAGPKTARTGATVTRFGTKLLVAGGSDPDRPAIDSADVFDPVARRFEARVALERSRAHHAAVVLASGETLLVGGSNAESPVLRGLELISPETAAYSVSGLTTLSVGRLSPQALRLSDDRILVAGGTSADGTPVDVLEWLAPDARRVEQESSLLGDPAGPPVADRAFVAMPAGSALAVGGCRLEQSNGCVPCSAGPATGCASNEVYWIRRDGVPELLPEALDTPVHSALLVDGVEGRPWLVTSSPAGPRLLRFDPWEGRFTEPEGSPPPPLAGFEHADVAPFEARMIATDPGLFLWLAKSSDGLPRIFGFRHATRSPYDAAVAPLLLANRDGIALGRRNQGDLDGLDSSGAAALTDPETTLVITDTTYADVDIAIDVVDGPPPLVVLTPEGQNEKSYGDGSCPWPAPPDGQPAPRVRRAGDQLTLTIGARKTTCTGPKGRVAISFRSPGATVRIRSIDVKRGS